MADDDIVPRPVRMPASMWAAVDEAAGPRGAGKFIRAAVEAALSGRTFEPTVQAYAKDISAHVAAAPRPKPVGLGLVSQAMAGREVVDSLDKRRVLECLADRQRSARDVAVALKMDFGTAGLVIADLVRDGVVRMPAKGGVLELVE